MKVIRYSLVCIWIFIVLLLKTLDAQEVLVNTTYHKHFSEQNLKSQKNQDTLELPFIEDFAKSVGYPDPNYWTDKDAFMNYQYPKNSISIGVITLDGVDYQGSLYGTANNHSFEADYLTSRPLYLNYPAEDSIYLSFYFQPGGFGDIPEPGDSLIVQFLNVEENQWETVWGASFDEEESTLTEFNRVNNTQITHHTDSTGHENFIQTLIPVIKDEYLRKGFQFRFHNYASTTPSKSIPSKAGNVDQWHIDFVRMDKNRSHNDTTINDIAFKKPILPLLKNYESIPWNHFSEAVDYEMKGYIEITYQNIGDKTINIDSREFEIIDRMGDAPTAYFTGGGGDDIPPYHQETYPRNIDYIFPPNDNDSAMFEIKSYLITDTISERAPYRWNDTLRYNQKFFNYYAYDDGTAENGYGITGQGSENAWVAYKFDNYKADSLQAIQIYFNQTLDSINQQSFTIHVWDDDNGTPGDLIYSQNSTRPEYSDSLNKFINYPLKEKLFLEPGTFYIGYEKYTTHMMNIGFDVNRNNKNKLFYNLDGDWIQSGINGSLMMRPVFGKHIPYTGEDDDITQIDKPNQDQKDVIIYPNPAQDYINIEVEGGENYNYSLEIYNMQGSLLKRKENIEGNININDLSSGVYMLKVQNNSTNNEIVKKLIIR
ncbi:MAG: T9SS type A sorting domain-containing protein [Bacteroidales bacterium]